jgi:outer membrane protein assembly factor BamB
VLVSSAAVRFATAGAWSHIQGPAYDRKTAEGATGAWKTGEPRSIWEMKADGGFSSFVTGEGRAFTVVPADGGGREAALALDRKTGKTLWQTTLGASQYANGGGRGARGNDGGDGPRATPVFAQGRVFVFGAKFDLTALDAATGKFSGSTT